MFQTLPLTLDGGESELRGSCHGFMDPINVELHTGIERGWTAIKGTRGSGHFPIQPRIQENADCGPAPTVLANQSSTHVIHTRRGAAVGADEVVIGRPFR